MNRPILLAAALLVASSLGSPSNGQERDRPSERPKPEPRTPASDGRGGERPGEGVPPLDSELPRIEVPPPPDERPGDRGAGEEPLLTPRQIEEVISIFREYDPELAQRLENWRNRDPDRIGQILRPQLPRIMQMVYLKRHNPQLFRLRVRDFRMSRQTEALGRDLRDALAEGDEPRAQRLRGELELAVAEHFDLRQEIREFELAQLEKRIAELREQIDQRREQQGRLIERRVKELTGEAGKTEW